MTWISAMPLEKLRRDGKAIAKVGGKQIAFFHVDGADLRLQQPLPP